MRGRSIHHPHGRILPNLDVLGIDTHTGSIDLAREAASKAGVEDRCRFVVVAAEGYPGSEYGLVTVFDALHDMVDPTGVAPHVRQTPSADGTGMIVEPFADERLESNLPAVSRLCHRTTLSHPMWHRDHAGEESGLRRDSPSWFQVSDSSPGRWDSPAWVRTMTSSFWGCARDVI